MTQAGDRPPTLHELPHELRGVRVCLRPYAAGDGAAVQEAIEESRDHLRPWMAWTDSRRTVQECEIYHTRRLFPAPVVTNLAMEISNPKGVE